MLSQLDNAEDVGVIKANEINHSQPCDDGGVSKAMKSGPFDEEAMIFQNEIQSCTFDNGGGVKSHGINKSDP